MWYSRKLLLQTTSELMTAGRNASSIQLESGSVFGARGPRAGAVAGSFFIRTSVTAAR